MRKVKYLLFAALALVASTSAFATSGVTFTTAKLIETAEADPSNNPKSNFINVYATLYVAFESDLVAGVDYDTKTLVWTFTDNDDATATPIVEKVNYTYYLDKMDNEYMIGKLTPDHNYTAKAEIILSKDGTGEEKASASTTIDFKSAAVTPAKGAVTVDIDKESTPGTAKLTYDFTPALESVTEWPLDEAEVTCKVTVFADGVKVNEYTDASKTLDIDLTRGVTYKVSAVSIWTGKNGATNTSAAVTAQKKYTAAIEVTQESIVSMAPDKVVIKTPTKDTDDVTFGANTTLNGTLTIDGNDYTADADVNPGENLEFTISPALDEEACYDYAVTVTADEEGYEMSDSFSGKVIFGQPFKFDETTVDAHYIQGDANDVYVKIGALTTDQYGAVTYTMTGDETVTFTDAAKMPAVTGAKDADTYKFDLSTKGYVFGNAFNFDVKAVSEAYTTAAKAQNVYLADNDVRNNNVVATISKTAVLFYEYAKQPESPTISKVEAENGADAESLVYITLPDQTNDGTEITTMKVQFFLDGSDTAIEMDDIANGDQVLYIKGAFENATAHTISAKVVKDFTSDASAVVNFTTFNDNANFAITEVKQPLVSDKYLNAIPQFTFEGVEGSYTIKASMDPYSEKTTTGTGASNMKVSPVVKKTELSNTITFMTIEPFTDYKINAVLLYTTQRQVSNTEWEEGVEKSDTIKNFPFKSDTPLSFSTQPDFLGEAFILTDAPDTVVVKIKVEGQAMALEDNTTPLTFGTQYDIMVGVVNGDTVKAVKDGEDYFATVKVPTTNNNPQVVSFFQSTGENFTGVHCYEYIVLPTTNIELAVHKAAGVENVTKTVWELKDFSTDELKNIFAFTADPIPAWDDADNTIEKYYAVNNIVYSGNAYAVYLEDYDGTAEFYNDTEFTADKAEYKATFATALGYPRTVVVPFDATTDNAVIDWMSGSGVDKDGNFTIRFSHKSENKVTANMPYLYEPNSSDPVVFSAEDATIKKSADIVEVKSETTASYTAVKTAVSMKGVYKAINGVEATAAVGEGFEALRWSPTTSTFYEFTDADRQVRPFQAMFSMSTETINEYTIGVRFGDDDATMIQAVEFDEQAPVYDVMGRKVANPVKGQIYIQNGVKVMAK